MTVTEVARPSTHRPPKPGRSLAEVCPELVTEWDVEANGELTPRDVSAGSDKKVSWVCPKGHRWQARLDSRVYVAGGAARKGCPVCAGRKVLAGFNDLATVRPDLASEWDFKANGALTPQGVIAGSGVQVHWVCPENSRHRWVSSVVSRNRGAYCPFCPSRFAPASAGRSSGAARNEVAPKTRTDNRRSRTGATSHLVMLLLRAGRAKACAWPGCDVAADESGIVRWGDEPLSLQVDHVNGDPSDNRLENLRFLCPNCHRLATARQRAVSRPTNFPDDIGLLLREIEALGWLGTARKYGRTHQASVQVHLLRRGVFPLPGTRRSVRGCLSDEEFFSRGTVRTTYLPLRFLLAGRGTSCEKETCPMGGTAVHWLGEVLAFDIEHLDGDPANNLLSNLASLCPNCHSQTATYCNSAERRESMALLPPAEEMHRRVSEIGVHAYAEELGVPASRVGYKLRRRGLPTRLAPVRERFGVTQSLDEILNLIRRDGWVSTGATLGGVLAADVAILLREEGVDPTAVRMDAKPAWGFELTIEEVSDGIRATGRASVARRLGVSSSAIVDAYARVGVEIPRSSRGVGPTPGAGARCDPGGEQNLPLPEDDAELEAMIRAEGNVSCARRFRMPNNAFTKLVEARLGHRPVKSMAEYPPVDELVRMIEESGFAEAGRQIGVTKGAVRFYLERRVDVLPVPGSRRLEAVARRLPPVASLRDAVEASGYAKVATKYSAQACDVMALIEASGLSLPVTPRMRARKQAAATSDSLDLAA